jgi:hypothetical protein
MWLLALPIHVWADAEVHEWIGELDMNHDGWLGTLSIMDSKQDCATSRWCHLVVKYTDKDGNRRTGRIARIDQRFQHMVFYVNFPDNAQKFDAYVFSWDKAKMAGTTIWGGRTFGFFATKK